ncbi:hypothetical protein VNO77_46262 [Canavalia gladiata]|uniref:Uncharacterized protein n=1 Tax=Canavalia gladiata TaxID=3824 RepID=A0AAN9PH03_CANGL
MLHRNPSLFLSSTEKGSFRVTRAISLFFFRYGNAMQEVSEIGLFLMMKTRYLKVGNVRRRLSVSDERGDDTWRGIPDRLVNETYKHKQKERGKVEKGRGEETRLNTSHWTRGAPNPPTHSSITVFS